jgi:hypothetical protein
MSKKFIQLTSGWIPVSVLLLLAAALVTGQAQANLPVEAKAVPAPVSSASVSIIVTGKIFERIDALPIDLHSVWKLPAEIQLRIDAGIWSTDGASESTPRSLKK